MCPRGRGLERARTQSTLATAIGVGSRAGRSAGDVKEGAPVNEVEAGGETRSGG